MGQVDRFTVEDCSEILPMVGGGKSIALSIAALHKYLHKHKNENIVVFGEPMGAKTPKLPLDEV